MTLMIFRWCWRLLLVLGVSLEVRALTNGIDGDTLSERVWWLVDLPWVGSLIRCTLAAFMAWLAVHFVMRGWVEWRGRELVVCLACGLAAWIVLAGWRLAYGAAPA